MTLCELNSFIISSLTPTLGPGEAKATARLLLEDDLRVTPAMLLSHGERILLPETVIRHKRFIDRIIAGEPPQYVVGSAIFMGMSLKVTPATLIPRPETAELVDLIVERSGRRHDLRILDIGTGSGCIALALARALPFSRVEGIDISAGAIAVARENAENLNAKIDFNIIDIFKISAETTARYDIIVSNPPYIADSERAAMEPRVKDHEPASALFVPDSDPLRFYRAIAEYAGQALADDGLLALEINPIFADRLTNLLANFGFDCDIRRDSYGKKRFALATHEN